MDSIKRKIKRTCKKVYNTMIGERDLWQQLLNIAVVIAIVGSAVSIGISVALNSSPYRNRSFYHHVRLCGVLPHTFHEIKRRNLCGGTFFHSCKLYPFPYYVLHIRRLPRRNADMVPFKPCYKLGCNKEKDIICNLRLVADLPLRLHFIQRDASGCSCVI